MRVAITGASGFIGKHVISQLLRKDLEIVAVTRHRESLRDFTDIEVIEHDIGNLNEDVFSKLKQPDVLVHLAWDGLQNYKSLQHYETELPKQYNFIKHMVEAGLKSLFVTGTCFEYGMQSGALAPNTITNPTNPYGFAKDALRKQLEYLQQAKPYNLTWARLFYMYGEGQASNSLYSQLKQAVLCGEKTFNMSGGDQVRDYLSVENVATNIVDLSLLRGNKGCVNICSEQPITVKDLVAQWLEENGWNISLNFDYYPYPDYEPMEFWGINKMEKKT